MSRLTLYSEPYSSTGNIGENFRRLLGAPSLDLLQTLIRESVQNIADAANLGQGPEIVIRVRRLSPQQVSALRNQVLAELPAEQTSRDRLQAFLAREQPPVLEICDFRTAGLGGPTRADRIPATSVRTDFINFLRNIGTPRDTEHGGGTYGFGKVALYRASKCGTILVDSAPADETGNSRRLIGCHIGASFELPEEGLLRRFTGRHWWGTPDPSDGIVDPIIGAEAEAMAEVIGFLPRGAGKTGTSIMILDFDLEEEKTAVVAGRIVEALLWNFWPRMMRDTPPDRRFHCEVHLDGHPFEVPAPEYFPPLDLFTKAMRAAREGSGNDLRPIAAQRPAKHLGFLAIEKGLRTPRRRIVHEGSLVPALSHHVALMRPVELVVRYLEGSPLPDERLEWAGVFIASEEHDVERAFADSEPPAHDDWIPESLPKGPAKTFVNVALRQLKAHAFEIGAQPPGQVSGSSAGPPLARVAAALGAALERVGGEGPGRTRATGAGGGSRPIRARASRPVFVRLERHGGETIAVFSTEVRQDRRRSGAVLSAEAAVAIEGSAASRLDGSIPQPSVTCIRAASGDPTSESNTIELGGDEGTYEILVRMPPDCGAIVDAQVLTEPES